MSRKYTELTSVAVQAALKAGEIIKQGFATDFEISAKPGRQNFVTPIDKGAEKAIFSFVKEKYPEHAFLGEESGFSGQDHEMLWIVDPLDGTTNFTRQIPIISISIAVCQKNVPLSAVVYNPLTDELFIAEKRKGAYHNGQQIFVSQIKAIEDSLIGFGFPYDDYEQPIFDFSFLERLLKKGASLRNLGSAALSLAYVAAGKLDAVCMNQLFPWDWVAGQLLIEEAGGKLTPSPRSNQSSCILASNGLLHSLLN
ncbi:MAG: inositol monophosphatase [Parachlamydia sp.]|jgi:myo-inositol-1(or 4)-monophosphatase|nr:inositol monophosphatase [Parachlamydia sp.]